MMRAKLMVIGVEKGEGVETVRFSPVCGTFDPNGKSEDNTYARWTPSGSVSLGITNPELHGKFEYGQKYYADFTAAE